VIASFLAGSLLTLLLPVVVLVLIGGWWMWAVRSRKEL